MAIDRAIVAFEGNLDDVPAGLPLVISLTGFADAGSVISQVRDVLRDEQEPKRLITFANDELLDYRSRRPIMEFSRDHVAGYRPLELALDLLHDSIGRPFLLLHGYEPDFRWERFTQAIVEYVNRLGVSGSSWVHSIPFPIPHTRKLGLAISGNQPEIAERKAEWRPQTQVPGNLLHLLEFEFTKLNHPITGYVLLVPHYLSDSEYPSACVFAMEQLMAHNGLIFEMDHVRDSALEFDRKLQEQLSNNDELANLVANLESGYATVAGRSDSDFQSKQFAEPDANQLADQLESFLASQNRDDETGSN